ncbi:MAG TPA: GNAT family N-acetyltransferase [Hymenobacter sp.]|jgi:ribosomal protein S18 acetylase RimI-like enzyme
MNPRISILAPEEIERAVPQLVALFQDAIGSGAALGFLPPLSAEEARRFWHRVQEGVRAGALTLFVARDEATRDILGTVQLAPAPQTNGTHRAEVAKMMVHRKARRLGIGRQLLAALETHAAQLGRTTLVLDTRQGDVAELLYQALQYQVAGVVPEYAQSGDGTLHATVVYYKLLTPEAQKTLPQQREA